MSSNSITKLLVDYIYKKINISKFNYKILSSEDDLSNFKDINNYYVSANFSGFNHLMVFCKIKDENYCYMVDRKTLKYNQEHIKYHEINIMKVKCELENSIYNGTIIDGTYVKNEKKRQNIFIINDIYMFRGETLENDKIQLKLKNIELYLDHHMKSSDIIFTINKLYEIKNIDKLINDDIPKTKDLHVRGISFYPKLSSTRLIYTFDNDTDKKTLSSSASMTITHSTPSPIHPKIEQPDEISKPKLKYVIREEYKDEIPIFILELQKTDKVDVYRIYAINELTKDDRKVLISTKLGIASIITDECSKMCIDIFNKTLINRILFKCQFIDTKWIPLESIQNDPIIKMPSKIIDIEKYLELKEVI